MKKKNVSKVSIQNKRKNKNEKEECKKVSIRVQIAKLGVCLLVRKHIDSKTLPSP